jgi:hypothetical protein
VSGKSEQFNTRLDPDDAAAVNEYADEHGVTKSEATRRVLRHGLKAKRRDGLRHPRAPLQIIGVIGGLIYILTFLLAPGFLGIVGGTYIIGSLVWANWPEWSTWAAGVRESVLGLSRDDAEADDGETEVNA